MTAAGRKEMFKKRQKHFPPASEINRNTPPTPLKKKKASLRVGWTSEETRVMTEAEEESQNIPFSNKQSLGVCINHVHGPGPRTTSRNGTICAPIFFIPGRVRFWDGNLAVNENDPRGLTPALTLMRKGKNCKGKVKRKKDFPIKQTDVDANRQITPSHYLQKKVNLQTEKEKKGQIKLDKSTLS